MQTRCAECGRTWGGYRAEHCTSCHQTFSGTSAGDAHRKGPFPNGRYCDTDGLEYDSGKRLWKMPPGDFDFATLKEDQ